MERRKVLAFVALLALLFTFLLQLPESQDTPPQVESVKPDSPHTFSPIPNTVDLSWTGDLSLLPGEKPEVLRPVSQVPHNQPGTQAPTPYVPGSPTGEKHRNQHATDQVKSHVPPKKGKGNVSKHNHSIRR